MKTITKILCCLGAAASAAVAAGASDRWETLRAINWVENPTNHARFGSKGELGPYQFRRDTWKMHTRRPFSSAVERKAADEVAVAHYEYLSEGLENAGLEASPYNIALAWNCGLGAVTSGRIPRVTYNYAERVQNLVESFKAQQRERATSPARKVAAVVAPAAPVQFNLENPAAATAVPVRFVVNAEAPRDPVVVTDKSVEEPRIKVLVDRPVFSVAAVGAPRFALIY